MIFLLFFYLIFSLDPFYDLEAMDNTSIKRDLMKIKKELDEESDGEEIVKKEFKNIYKI